MAIHTQYHVVLQGTKTSRPATPTNDLLYISTDTVEWSYYDTVGAAWSAWFSPFTAPLGIASGGTGQTAKTAAFDALSPTTTKGDVIASNGTNNVRKAAGQDYQTIVADSSASDGLSWLQRRHQMALFTSSSATNFTTGAAYAAVFGAAGSSPTQTKVDFQGWRQARIRVNAAISVLTVDAYIKIVDVTNSKDVTNAAYINSTTFDIWDSTWLTLDAATIAGDAKIEAQAIQGTGADVLRIDNIYLELK